MKRNDDVSKLNSIYKFSSLQSLFNLHNVNCTNNGYALSCLT